MVSRFFEDFSVGDTFDTSESSLSESDIIAYATIYDRQPFHVDPAVASKTIYGGLIASGYQTLSLAWSQFIGLGLLEATSMGGTGLNYVKFLRPVRPGDKLRVRVEVVQKKPTSKDDRGIVVFRHKARNQKMEDVLEYESVNLVKRR